MTYMVMETHFSYAVVLDERGKIFPVANMGYEVGDQIKSVFPMWEEETGAEDMLPALKKEDAKETKKEAIRKKGRKIWLSAAAAAACILLMFTFLSPKDMKVMASVYMTINPEVRMDLNQSDTVIGLEGINDDGTVLIAGYDYDQKNLQEVTDDLIDRAIEMGFLYEGGELILDLDAEDEEWIQITGVNLRKHLTEYLEGKVSVTTKIRKYDSQNIAEEEAESDSESDMEITAGAAGIQQSGKEQDSGYRESSGIRRPSAAPPSSGDSDYNEDEPDENEPDENGGDEIEEETGGNSDYGDSEYGDSAYDSSNGNSEYD